MHTRALQKPVVLCKAVVLVLIAASCSHQEQPPKAMYTVDEYLAKPDVMAAKLGECANNPGELRENPDCINVKEAAKRQGVGSWKDMEPLKFPRPGSAAKNKPGSPEQQ